MQNQQYILVYGNIADGMTFLGPYTDAEAAMEYAESFLTGENWDVIELSAPPTLEEFEPKNEMEEIKALTSQLENNEQVLAGYRNELVKQNEMLVRLDQRVAVLRQALQEF